MEDGGRREEDKRLIPSYKSDVDSNPGVILQGNPAFRWKNGAPVSERKPAFSAKLFFYFPTFASEETRWRSPSVATPTSLPCPSIGRVLGF